MDIEKNPTTDPRNPYAGDPAMALFFSPHSDLAHAPKPKRAARVAAKRDRKADRNFRRGKGR